MIRHAELLLRNYNSLKASIHNMEQEIKEIEQERACISSIDYSKDKVTTSSVGSSTESEATRNVDRVMLLKVRVQINKSKVERIERAMGALNDTERFVIKSHSIDGLPYYSFCYRVHVSERTAKRIKFAALEKIEIALFG